MKAVAYFVALVACIYLEGWLLSGDRSVWWSFPTHIMCMIGLVVFGGMTLASWEKGK